MDQRVNAAGVAQRLHTHPAQAANDERASTFVQLHQEDAEAVRAELLAGLLAPQAFTSPKYLYDSLGSRLFEAITELPEYYPTRTEAAIFSAHQLDMAHATGTGHTLVDLGAGNCAKAASMFDALKPSRYVAVDISVEFLRASLDSLQRQHPHLPMVGVGMDFSSRLDLPRQVDGEWADATQCAGTPTRAAPASKRLFFYPGSSIGNFSPPEALAFLKQVHACSQGGGLLIGVDMVKCERTLALAYDDPLGVTGAFNLNMLRHVNTLVGTDFEVVDWRHIGIYNSALSRIEMHVEARHALAVRWPNGERQFAQGERIHTESSYKYTPDSFAGLLREAGFSQTRCWQDEQKWFSVFYAAA